MFGIFFTRIQVPQGLAGVRNLELINGVINNTPLFVEAQ